MSRLIASGILQQSRNQSQPGLDTANILFWYNAENVVESGGLISQATDLSGNGLHCVQATSSYQPSLVSNQLNGYPVMRFNVSKNLKASFSQSQPITIYIVFKTTSTGYQIVFDSVSGTYGIMELDGGNVYMYHEDYSSNLTAFSLSTPFNFLLMTCVYNQANSGAFVNGVERVSGKDVGDASRSGITLGSYKYNNQGLVGDIAEVIAYTEAPNAAKRQNIEGYLMTKYGLSA